MFVVSWQRRLLELTLLFASGLALGTLLRLVGLLPALQLWPAPVAQVPPSLHTPARPAGEVTSLVPAAPQTVERESIVVPLTGDGDHIRDSLRRAVIVSARQALGLPCDADARIAFQITLRDYVRVFATAPGRYRTALDGEVGRALALSHHAGLIDPQLVERWRASERAALASLLAGQGLALASSPGIECRSG